MTSKNWAKFRSLFAVLEHSHIFSGQKFAKFEFAAMILFCCHFTMCKLYNKLLFVKQSRFLLCEAIFFFFVGNSRLNWRIIESIFDTTLFTLTLTRLFTRTYACSDVTKIRCFKFCYLEFSFGYLENSLLRILLSRIFEKDHEFFASNPTKDRSKIRWLFVENSQEQKTNFDEFRLHYFCNFTVPVLARIWHATRHAKQKVWTSIVLLIKYAHMACCMSRSACRVMHACPCHHLFVGFPMDGHI